MLPGFAALQSVSRRTGSCNHYERLQLLSQSLAWNVLSLFRFGCNLFGNIENCGVKSLLVQGDGISHLVEKPVTYPPKLD